MLSSISSFYLLLFLLSNLKLPSSNSFCNTTIPKCGCSLQPLSLQRTGRILGGERVIRSETWPWMISIRRWGHHICGGVIISPLFILTAAHCIPSTGLSIAFDFIQQSNLTFQDPRIRAITKVYTHSNFSRDQLHNDLALLQLEQPLKRKSFNEICLPDVNENLSANTEVIALGFGLEKESSTRSSDNLRQIKLKILSSTSDRCLDDLIDPRTQICAGSDLPKQDTCKGDSGGPLMYFSPNQSHYELIGIISSGIGCGHLNHPGIYTRVSPYLSWIKTILNEN